MNNIRYCLHCQIFGEARQEMKVDVAHMEKYANPFTKESVHKLMAICPKCKSIEYFFG